jgi:hypothetical protein
MDTVGLADPLEFAGYPMTQAFSTLLPSVLPVSNTYTVGVNGTGLLPLLDGVVGQFGIVQVIMVSVTLLLITPAPSITAHSSDEGCVFTVTMKLAPNGSAVENV